MTSNETGRSGLGRTRLTWYRGLKRFALPGVVAGVLVVLLKRVGIIGPGEGFLTVWGVWSALLAAAYNSVLREQKQFDDASSHEANMREFEILKALLQLRAEKEQGLPSRAAPGMAPVGASKKTGEEDAGK